MKFKCKKIFFIVMVMSLLMVAPLQTSAEVTQEIMECNAISIAIDVSGSMKKTDSHKHSIELIKLCMDVCNETDYLSVTAYNDQIVYHSGLISMGNSEEKEKLIEELDALQFGGETDNGLGLLTATKAIADSDLEYNNAFIIMISDGNTDLENSKTDRITADSDADIRTSTELAIENDIMINVVGYTNAYNQDTGMLSVASASTGGSTTVVNNAPQFVQVVLSTFFYGYEYGKASFQTEEITDVVNRFETSTELTENQKCYEVFFSTERMSNCEVVNADDNVQIFQGNNYLVQRMDEKGLYDLKTIYSVENPATIITGTIKIDKEEAEALIPEPILVPVEEPGQTPTGEDVVKQLYAAKTPLIMDVSGLFEDADDDIVRYSVVQSQGEAICTLSGSMISIEMTKPGENQYIITAEDSKQNKKEISLSLEIVPAWKQYEGGIIAALIGLIVLLALGICACIVKAVLFGYKKEHKAISGNLKAYFIDLKSKNEAVDMSWNLEDYPPEGVTLEELFLSKGIKENFQDIGKVCFYPGKNSHELVLVHCMEGGIFLGDQNLRANKPVTISSGDIIYISFAENASEIELKYTAQIDRLER